MGSMDNISQNGASFEFAGKTRNMIFINRAVRWLKEKHGGFQKAIRMIDDENGEMDMSVFADILFAGFMAEKDPLTIEQVETALGEMPYFETRKIATTHLVAAITGTYPKPKDGDSSTPQ